MLVSVGEKESLYAVTNTFSALPLTHQRSVATPSTPTLSPNSTTSAPSKSPTPPTAPLASSSPLR